MIEQADGTKIAVPVEELEEISSPAVEQGRQSDATNNEGQDDKEDKKQ